MRYVIAGSRSFNDEATFKKVLTQFNDITEVVCGCSEGADALGAKWAQDNHIKLTLFRLDWDQYGSSADYMRNYNMEKYSDILVAFWDGHSYGTKHMIGLFKNAKKPLYVYNYQGEPID